jgi:hypothetical protein
MKGLQNVNIPKSGDQFKFKRIDALSNPAFIAYLDTESCLKNVNINNINSSNIHINSHVMLAYGYVILNKDKKVVKTKNIVLDCENIAANCLNSLLDDYNKLIIDFQFNLNEVPVLTEHDKFNFDYTTHCPICDSPFSDVIVKCKHHDHTRTIEKDVQGNIIKGNYVCALCRQCNLKITHKRKCMPVVIHNGGKYDFKNLLKGASDSKLLISSVLSKQSDCLFSFNVNRATSNTGGKREYGLRFIDSINFLKGSLDDLASTLFNGGYEMDNARKVLKQLNYSEEAITLSLQKGVFPYEWLDDSKKLMQEELPEQSAFFSQLKNAGITNEEYARAKSVWHAANCKNMIDYLKLYLWVDILLLMEVFENFRDKICVNYTLDPINFVSSPGLALNIALYMQNVSIDLLNDYDVITQFQHSIRGGFTTLVEPHVIANNKNCPNYDDKKENIDMLYLDFNSMYAGILADELPTGNFYCLTENEIRNFDVFAKPMEEYTYALEVDYTIPPDIARQTDDLPLGLSHKTPLKTELSPFTIDLIDKSGLRSYKRHPKLIACHDDKTNYLILLDLLQLYLNLGAVLNKIHKIYRFNQSAIFKDFIIKNNTLRTKATSPAEKDFFKLLSNSLYGKCLENPQKRSEVFRVINSENRFRKYAMDPFLKRCYKISENVLIMVFAKDEIYLNTPTFIGFFVLEKAKLMLYDFFYNTLKKHYKDNISLIYSDTDSLLLKLKGIDDIFNEIQKMPLCKYIDTSNFDSRHELYSCVNKGKFGKLKSETGNLMPAEFIGLQPKCYSIKLNNEEVKNAAKGVQMSKKRMLKHEHYRDIHESFILNYVVEICNISSKHCQLYTSKLKKNALSKLDDKRFYISNNKTLAYNHPDINTHLNFINNEENKKANELDKKIVKKKQLSSAFLMNDNQKRACHFTVDLTFKRRKNSIFQI